MTESPSHDLPSTPWDLTLSALTHGMWVLGAGAVALLFLGERMAFAALLMTTGAFLVTAVAMAHLSCQCGGRLPGQVTYRVSREGECLRMCPDCAAGLGPEGDQCCPHGIPWSGWPCRECQYPAVFGPVPGQREV